MSNEPRYIVTELAGYTITPSSSYGGSSKAQYSYSVLDTCDAYREVGAYYTSRTHRQHTNERAAYALARLLNRQDRCHEAKFVDNVYNT